MLKSSILNCKTEYNYKIHCIRGIQNFITDSLSHLLSCYVRDVKYDDDKRDLVNDDREATSSSWSEMAEQVSKSPHYIEDLNHIKRYLLLFNIF